MLNIPCCCTAIKKVEDCHLGSDETPECNGCSPGHLRLHSDICSTADLFWMRLMLFAGPVLPDVTPEKFNPLLGPPNMPPGQTHDDLS